MDEFNAKRNEIMAIQAEVRRMLTSVSSDRPVDECEKTLEEASKLLEISQDLIASLRSL